MTPLKLHVLPGNGFSNRAGKAWVRLDASLPALRKSSAQLRRWWSARQLRQRVACPSAGIGKAFNRSDRCPVCKAWDDAVCRELVKTTRWSFTVFAAPSDELLCGLAHQGGPWRPGAPRGEVKLGNSDNILYVYLCALPFANYICNLRIMLTV